MLTVKDFPINFQKQKSPPALNSVYRGGWIIYAELECELPAGL